jgi:hypothetical protein
VRAQPAPRSHDEKIADERIILRGVPYLNKHYPLWRTDAYSSAINISDPKRCMLAYLEGIARTFGRCAPRNYRDIRWHTLQPVPFREVLALHATSLEEAIACGFARAETDPVTFYAALRDRWSVQLREDEALHA